MKNKYIDILILKQIAVGYLVQKENGIEMSIEDYVKQFSNVLKNNLVTINHIVNKLKLL